MTRGAGIKGTSGQAWVIPAGTTAAGVPSRLEGLVRQEADDGVEVRVDRLHPVQVRDLYPGEAFLQDPNADRYMMSGSRGRPSIRSAIWFRLISDVPPAIDRARFISIRVAPIAPSPSRNAASGPASSAMIAAVS